MLGRKMSLFLSIDFGGVTCCGAKPVRDDVSFELVT